jgi:RimJ/RimL family protein N-acetyltransferase
MAALRAATMCNAFRMADVETITDAGAVLDRCGDLFRADPVGCNMVSTAVSPTADVEVVRVYEGADTLGVALVAGGSCTLTTCSPESIALFVDALSSEGPLSVSGPAGAVADLAGRLAERADGAVTDPRLFRMYRADQVTEPSKRRRGKVFVTEPNRIDQATEWGVGSWRDTGLGRSADDVLAQAERAVNEHRLLEWRSKGEVVSQLVISAVRFGVVRIGFVSTPPEHRKKGHGAAFVAAVAQQQLDRQKVDSVVLNTQSENAATNRMYRALGFAAAVEMLSVQVVSA